MASLLLGSFEMLRTDGSARVMAEGTSWGEPVPIEVTVKSWLQDGAIVVTQGHDNREVNVRVRFYGDDLTALATLEASLFAELEEPNTLTWSPGGTTPATVFVVVTSSLVQQDESFVGEVQGDPWRTYNIRLVCEAFTRSAAEVTVAALTASGTTTTLVNDGSATTNWTGLVDGVSTSPTVVSGAVRVTGTSSIFIQPSRVSATLTTAITTSSTKYIMVDWKPESPVGNPVLHAYGDAVELTRVAETVSPTSGFTRTWFGPVAASSIAALKLETVSTGGTDFAGSSTTRSIYVDNVNRTDVKPAIGTNRQFLRAVDLTGSADSIGSIALEHASSALGDAIIYAFPETRYTVGYSPPCRQYRVSGGTVTGDATMVSGSHEDMGFGGTLVYDIPTSKLAAGIHQIAIKAAMAVASTATFTWTAQTRVNSTNVGPALTGAATRSLTTTQTIFTLGRVMLPPSDLDEGASNAVVRISIAISSGVTAVDEVWLFNTTVGHLVGPVSCGTAAPASGGAANRLFLEPPTPARPRPTLRIGFASDRSDAYYPGAVSGQGSISGWQLSKFEVPRMVVFTVTTNALDASVTFRYYPRWHTNAAS